MPELLTQPIHQLARALREREMSAVELVGASLAAIEAAEPSIGAFADVAAEAALAEAQAIGADDPRPFAGVPIAVKANVAVKGMLCEHGSRYLQGLRPEHDSFLVRRLREAGFVVVGTTKLPEFGILPSTEPALHGPARNPWNTAHTPGGSSGGSGAAVAAGVVPLAHGNDGGGSIRIPAACCGLVGLKPSRGRISRGPELGDSLLAVDGVLTHHVSDTALALDVLWGYEAGDATWAPPPAEPYAAAVSRLPGRLRVGVSTANAIDAPVDPRNLEALRAAADLLASLGHEVEEADPPFPGVEALALFTGVFFAWISLTPYAVQMIQGREPGPDDLEPLSRAVYEQVRSSSAVDYLGQVAQLQAMTRRAIAYWGDYDLLLCPVLAERPLPIGELNGLDTDDPLRPFARSASFTPYTALFNVTGQPAVSIPMGTGDDGLPTAVQLVGRPLAEDTLLQVAAQVEQARPWPLTPPAPGAPAAG